MRVNITLSMDLEVVQQLKNLPNRSRMVEGLIKDYLRGSATKEDQLSLAQDYEKRAANLKKRAEQQHKKDKSIIEELTKKQQAFLRSVPALIQEGKHIEALLLRFNQETKLQLDQNDFMRIAEVAIDSQNETDK